MKKCQRYLSTLALKREVKKTNCLFRNRLWFGVLFFIFNLEKQPLIIINVFFWWKGKYLKILFGECRYIFFADKVEIQDISDKTCLFALVGPKSNQVRLP